MRLDLTSGTPSGTRASTTSCSTWPACARWRITREVALYDPRGEVVPSRLDALSASTEALVYVDHGTAVLTQLCVDLANIVAGSSATEPRVTCQDLNRP